MSAPITPSDAVRAAYGWLDAELAPITGGLINAVQVSIFAVAAHVYSSTVRATGVGTAAAFGRIGSILSGYAGAWAIDYRGSVSYFAMIAAAMCVTFISLALISRHIPRAGQRAV